MRKILVLGASGMLGNDLMKAFADLNLTGWSSKNIDITNEKQVNERLSKLNPGIVINAAAYTDVDGCETNKEAAMKINGKAVGYIAKACKKTNSILVHISTDYVFDGNKQDGYKEDDDPNPINVYGASKLLGEQSLIKNMNKYYLVRTSWLFGVNGKNFVETILRLAGEKNEINVVDDQFGSPTYTLDLANEIRKLIESEKDFGIYHVTNSGHCSWYEFAKEIVKLSCNNCKINPIPTEKYPLPAKRPKCSILLNTKLNTGMRHWKDALKDYMEVRK
ncbi:dTDP-4-dehydrorhamnose reductase [Candidatus Woesearchaeota archaeon]|nr:MAG: dTDP-4-dehydrorhamnose reductase [Candidatus Woesearchaeota archaeon]